MAPPPSLAALPGAPLSERQMLAAWIDDMTAYQLLREQTRTLQGFIQSDCQ